MRLDGNKLVVVAMGLAVLAVISTYSGCSKPPETVKPKPDAPVITINVAPDLNLQSLVASGEPAAIDYILDGVVIISDMHLLPNELTTLAQEFQYWTTDYLNRPNNQGLSNGLLSIRAPFNGTYFSVNNDKHQMENTKKHLHLLWLATNQQSASQFSTLHQQLTQLNKTDVTNALFAQAEFFAASTVVG
ncbi:MAG: hypothetical protein IPG70_08615 [Moraxellaceae bacterium]|nr:hypothetical protein [Moraxellaceae bacterium]